MKKSIVFITILLLVFIVACTATEDNIPAATNEQAAAAEQKKEISDSQASEISVHDFGAISAMEKTDLTIEEMLKFAIQDEFLARQEYELIMKEYGEQKPFSNIIRAEETHIALLKDIYDKYVYDIPEDNAIDYTVIPTSLEEAFDVGVKAEIDNIAMYEKFLENDLPDDIRAVFIELRDGSVSHLAAFERGVRGNGNAKQN